MTEYIELIDGRYRVIERYLVSYPIFEDERARKKRVKAGKPQRMIEYMAVRIERAYR